MPDRITAVMAAYNAEETIASALTSILSSDSDFDVEVVVFDDGSTDGTAEVVRSIADPRIRLISAPENVGRAEARNRAIRACTSDWIMVCDADDITLPVRLRVHYEHLILQRRDVSSGQMLDIRPSGTVSPSEFTFPTSSTDIDLAFKRGRMPVAHPASAFSRRVFDSLEGYDPSLLWCEDYDFYLRAWDKGFTFAQSDAALIMYRRRSVATSWTYWRINATYHSAIWSRFRSRRDHRSGSIARELGRSTSRWTVIRSWSLFARYRVLLWLKELTGSKLRNIPAATTSAAVAP